MPPLLPFVHQLVIAVCFRSKSIQPPSERAVHAVIEISLDMIRKDTRGSFAFLCLIAAAHCQVDALCKSPYLVRNLITEFNTVRHRIPPHLIHLRK